VSRSGAGRLFAVVAIFILIDIVYSLISGKMLSLTSLTSSLLTGITLGFIIAWLIGRMRLRRLHALLLIWIDLYVIMFFSNILEGYFFTMVFSSLNVFAIAISTPLAVTLIEACSAAALLPAGDRSLSTLLKEHISSRSLGSWVKRIIAGSIIYFPIYLFFGMLVYPLVADYYSNPAAGLRVPGFEVIVPLELFRGFLYVIVLLPVVASLREDHKTSFTAIFLMLFIIGAFIPLTTPPSLPPEVIPFHLVELLADSLVYGFALSRILSRPKLGP